MWVRRKVGAVMDDIGIFVSRVSRLFSLCESPVEREFLAGMLVGCEHDCVHYDIDVNDRPFAVVILGDRGIGIWPQVPIGPYRADFAVYAAPTHEDAEPLAKAIIEIDGHDWHDRTKKQASHDRRRDRAFLVNGFTTIRFTGSDVTRDPCGCALETQNILTKMAWG